MIDIESQVFTRIHDALQSAFPGIRVKSLAERVPASFPAVYVEEEENSANESTQTSDSLENHAVIAFKVEVYSNAATGRKSQARKIARQIDEEFAHMGFTRTFFRPTPNLADETIYRMTGRYVATVSADHAIYRR